MYIFHMNMYIYIYISVCMLYILNGYKSMSLYVCGKRKKSILLKILFLIRK